MLPRDPPARCPRHARGVGLGFETCELYLHQVDELRVCGAELLLATISAWRRWVVVGSAVDQKAPTTRWMRSRMPGRTASRRERTVSSPRKRTRRSSSPSRIADAWARRSPSAPDSSIASASASTRSTEALSAETAPNTCRWSAATSRWKAWRASTSTGGTPVAASTFGVKDCGSPRRVVPLSSRRMSSAV